MKRTRKPVASKPVSAEDRLIARYFRPIATHPGALGLTDDAAIFTPPKGWDVVLTADAVVAGVHFFPDDPPEKVAQKALRVNLSDLAAKGARPAGFLLTLALPKSVSEDWIKKFARGLGKDSDDFGCPSLGGDSVRLSRQRNEAGGRMPGGARSCRARRSPTRRSSASTGCAGRVSAWERDALSTQSSAALRELSLFG